MLDHTLVSHLVRQLADIPVIWLLGECPTLGPRFDVSLLLPASDICNADIMMLSEAVSEAADIRASGADLGDRDGFALDAVIATGVTTAGVREAGWGTCGERGRRGEGMKSGDV